MAKPKFDGVIEAVHYQPDGQVEWVRAYERRGPAFSERILLDRQTLVERLVAGQRFVVGKRLPYLGSTFEVSQPVHLVQRSDGDALVVGDVQGEQDRLEGVPVI